ALLLVAAVAGLASATWRRARDDASELGAAWGLGLLALTLLGPMLLPWYVAWSLPIAWLLPRRAWIALVGTSVALGVSLVAAEPGRFPAVFDANLLVGHWIVTPAVLALLVLAGSDLRRRFRGATPFVEDAREVSESRGER
ncbi:MAG: hypothetical protein ACKO8G_07795, partial [Actinomycetota bacterium]